MLQKQNEALHSFFSNICHYRHRAGTCIYQTRPLQAFTVLSRKAFTLRRVASALGRIIRHQVEKKYSCHGLPLLLHLLMALTSCEVLPKTPDCRLPCLANSSTMLTMQTPFC